MAFQIKIQISFALQALLPASGNDIIIPYTASHDLKTCWDSLTACAPGGRTYGVPKPRVTSPAWDLFLISVVELLRADELYGGRPRSLVSCSIVPGRASAEVA